MQKYCEKTYVSLLQLRPQKFPLQRSGSNMANNRVIICPDLPRTVPIYARLDNHSCDQPAHMAQPPLAFPLLSSALQPYWLAFNSSKHGTLPNLTAFALISSLPNALPPSIYLFLLDSYLSFSLSSNITSSERSLLHPQTGVINPLLHIPLCFFHSTYNKYGFTCIGSSHDYYLSMPLDQKLLFWSEPSLYSAQGLTHSKYLLNE